LLAMKVGRKQLSGGRGRELPNELEEKQKKGRQYKKDNEGEKKMNLT